MATTLSREEILRRIEGISNDLKGPGIPHIERLLMHEDRKDLRQMLRELYVREDK